MAKENKNSSPSQEFLEKKEIFDLDLKVFQKKHEMKMEELKFARENDRLHNERELERGRIKSAEIRKTLIHKEQMRNYPR